jgi:hypothetical protein
MRRPTAIMLVLMGGGAVLWGATKGPSRACADARAQHRPDAEAICASTGGSGGHGSSSGYYHSGTGGAVATAATAAAVAHGGFGAAGHAAASGS